ncbi:LytTR family DNA-binding domain-containing protein [Amphibacillus indicireducens]|uniref:LytTR family DNA-binding domain-containing protein n=1 Tax=Amphibacillus indicireducens TaxID=1076330 RepID=A0ABP7VHZ5_9BACI
MIRVAIVEDEINYQKQLIEYLQRFEQERDETIQIETFTDGDQFVENYQAQFDLILMDVQMPLMDGMSAAEEIRKTDSEVVIIFITNMPQFAIKGYAVDALDYILKPISYFQFSERLNRAINRMEKRETQHVTVKLKDGVIRLETSDIYFIESQGHDLIFTTKKGEYVATGTMKDMESELEKFHFFRGHRGYLINLQHVDGTNENGAIVGGAEIPISRSKKKPFMKALASYWGKVIK